MTEKYFRNPTTVYRIEELARHAARMGFCFAALMFLYMVAVEAALAGYQRLRGALKGMPIL